MPYASRTDHFLLNGGMASSVESVSHLTDLPPCDVIRVYDYLAPGHAIHEDAAYLLKHLVVGVVGLRRTKSTEFRNIVPASDVPRLASADASDIHAFVKQRTIFVTCVGSDEQPLSPALVEFLPGLTRRYAPFVRGLTRAEDAFEKDLISAALLFRVLFEHLEPNPAKWLYKNIGGYGLRGRTATSAALETAIQIVYDAKENCLFGDPDNDGEFTAMLYRNLAPRIQNLLYRSTFNAGDIDTSDDGNITWTGEPDPDCLTSLLHTHLAEARRKSG